MGWSEYRLATLVLRFLGRAFARFPFRRRRVVLASARTPGLEGNLAALHDAIRRRDPRAEIALLLEPYSYGLLGKLMYLVRLIRGTYFLQTSGLVVVDNAWFPIHVAPHRPETTVVQVWHAAGALKRFGLDAPVADHEAERTFLHRYYDYVVVAGQTSREPYASALRTPRHRVLPLGSPRTDFFFDEAQMGAARQRLLARHPDLRHRRVVLYAPTFRGRGGAKRAAPSFNAARLRSLLPREYALVLKTHPNLPAGATRTSGYDAIIDPTAEINEVFTIADILVTDYSSSIFEWALLRKPLVLMVPDLRAYETDPGLYLDYRTELIGTSVADTDEVAEAILKDRFVLDGYDEFIARHLEAADGHASERFVSRFLEAPRRRARLRTDVRHQ
jgi:CDP-glycerol glycerophosphotransferase (TagB/SpsB family)